MPPDELISGLDALLPRIQPLEVPAIFLRVPFGGLDHKFLFG